MASVAPRWARGLSSQQLAALADTPSTGAVPPDEPLAKISMDLPKGHVTRIHLTCGTVLEIYPGKDSQGHFRPELHAPSGTEISHEPLKDKA